MDVLKRVDFLFQVLEFEITQVCLKKMIFI